MTHVLVGLTTKSALVDLALGSPGEGHAVVFQLDDGLRSLTGHVVDGVLVAQPVRSLDCVIHVPAPVVGLHVAQSCVDTALGGDCM